MNQETKTIAPQEPTLFGWDCFSIPCYAAHSLIIGELDWDTGLKCEELEVIQTWIDYLEDRDFHFSESTHFTWKPEFGEPSECFDLLVSQYTK